MNETNLIEAISQLISQKQNVSSGGQSAILLGIILAAIAPTLAAFAGWLNSRTLMFTSKMAAEKSDIAATKADEAKEAVRITSATAKEREGERERLLNLIHNEVNGRSAEMAKLIETLHAEILRLTNENASQAERLNEKAPKTKS